MSQPDITQQILELHEEKIVQTLRGEVQEELKNGIPLKLQDELDALLSRANAPNRSSQDNVIAFKPRKSYKQQILKSFESVELLAAAGQSLGEWFSTPISFTEKGFILDIRRVIGSDNEVDLYLSPIRDDSDKMKKSLTDYTGQNINIIVSNKNTVLLESTLYIDEDGNAAEGSGVNKL